MGRDNFDKKRVADFATEFKGGEAPRLFYSDAWFDSKSPLFGLSFPCAPASVLMCVARSSRAQPQVENLHDVPFTCGEPGAGACILSRWGRQSAFERATPQQWVLMYRQHREGGNSSVRPRPQAAALYLCTPRYQGTLIPVFMACLPILSGLLRSNRTTRYWDMPQSTSLNVFAIESVSITFLEGISFR